MNVSCCHYLLSLGSRPSVDNTLASPNPFRGRVSHAHQIRLPAIRGLPYLCKDTVEHLPKIADVLCQLLISGKKLIQMLLYDCASCFSARPGVHWSVDETVARE